MPHTRAWFHNWPGVWRVLRSFYDAVAFTPGGCGWVCVEHTNSMKRIKFKWMGLFYIGLCQEIGLELISLVLITRIFIGKVDRLQTWREHSLPFTTCFTKVDKIFEKLSEKTALNGLLQNWRLDWNNRLHEADFRKQPKSETDRGRVAVSQPKRVKTKCWDIRYFILIKQIN